jgi:hypothetical protein
MITDLLLVFGGLLGGILLTLGFVRWDLEQADLQAARLDAIRRHPTHQADDLNIPDWLD